MLKKGDTVFIAGTPAQILEIDYGVARVRKQDGSVHLITLDRLSRDRKYYDKSKLKAIDELTEDDRKKLAKYLPMGASTDEYMVVSMIAADNMIDHSMGRWTPDSLEKLAKYAAGYPVESDHAGSIESKSGIVFDTGMIAFETVPTYFTNTSDNGRYNREIVKREGYQGFLIRAAIPRDTTLRPIDMTHVSLGYSFQDMRCPLCQTSFSNHKECKHLPPRYSAEREQENVAPWWEKDNPTAIYEVSFVAEPNLPMAGILRGVHKPLLKSSHP